MKQNQFNEINIFEVFHTLWIGKLKLFGFIVISVLCVLGYQNINNSPATISTQIKPLPMTLADNYRLFNVEADFKITAPILLNLFIKELEESTVFEDVIRDFELLDINDYENQEAYDKANQKLSSLIKILPPTTDEKKVPNRKYWTIIHKSNNVERWSEILSSVNILVNQNVQKFLEQQFKTTMAILLEQKKFKIEDIQVKIENSFIDNDKKVDARLSYLQEQGEIARKLNLAKSSIGTETIITKNSIVSNLNKDTPFYMRGFTAIEEEIEQINKRINNDIFSDQLIVLESELRTLKQDKRIERLAKNFSKSNIVDPKKFVAASIETNLSKVKYTNKKLMLILGALIGGLIGSIFLIFTSITRKPTR